ncbi:MAG TPA: diguanylate cyclase [Planctomycetota bacterium]|nr:diguanylate cyclase [Planctomycetota bacterium]
MPRKVFDELKQTGQLPSPNGVGMRILCMTQSEDCSFDELVAVLQADPALTGRIVKLASSAQMSGTSPITSLKDAAMRLGLRTVSNVALGFTLVANNKEGACDAFDYEHYWTSSLARAIAAQELSRDLSLGVPAEAFTVGLLSRVGELALASVHPREYAELLARLRAEPDQNALRLETEAFGIDRSEVAAALLGDWGFPDAFCDAVALLEERRTSGRELGGTGHELLIVLQDAAVLAELCMQGDQPDPLLVQDLEALRQRLEVRGLEVVALWERVLAEWREWGRLLELPTELLASSVEPQRVLAREVEVPGPAPAGEVVRSGLQGEGIRVLAVDDDPVSLKVLIHLLRQNGHEVHAAQNGRQALALTVKVRPHLIVTDWSMPDMDGVALCRALRRSRIGSRIYVLLVTGHGEEERVLEAFDAGVDDYVVKPYRPRLLMARLRAGIRLVRLQEQVDWDRIVNSRNAAQLAKLNRQLAEAANTDFLTGLPNRRFVMERFADEWKRARNLAAPLSVIMLDLDHFKTINDRFGHETGDVVLRETARMLRQSVRREDVAARIGGEEFFVLCPATDAVEAAVVAERVREAIGGTRIRHGGFDGYVTISAGVAALDLGAVDTDSLLRRADEAVYASKSAGRNRVTVDPGAHSGRRSA